ncbi:MAG: GAF domain-containing protein [Chloroflexi bacterium]|nr:GAF domain-containing protein [Chloroflexota bacterium]
MEDNGIQNIVQFLRRDNIRLREDNVQLTRKANRLQRILDALQALQEVSVGLNVRTDILFLMKRILESALTSIRAEDGSLMLLDEDTNELVFVVVHGQASNKLIGYRIKSGAGIAGWVAANKESVVVQDVNEDPRFWSEVDEAFDFNTRSMICVPIIYGEDVIGVFQALNKRQGEAFTEEDLTLLGVVAQLAATAMTNMERLMETADTISA